MVELLGLMTGTDFISAQHAVLPHADITLGKTYGALAIAEDALVHVDSVHLAIGTDTNHGKIPPQPIRLKSYGVSW